jgi:UDP-N-acetylglucosamine:LPS N-acetylglucosamine transferase
VLEEEAGDVAALGRTVGRLLRDRARRERMAAAAAALARPDAADRIVTTITSDRSSEWTAEGEAGSPA